MGKSAIGMVPNVYSHLEKFPDGKVEPTLIGSVPDMQSEIAVEALNLLKHLLEAKDYGPP